MKQRPFIQLLSIFLFLVFSLFLLNSCESGGGGGGGENPTPTPNSPTSDPLFKYQWHLDNTGQTAFSSNAGTAGEDINLQDVWDSHDGTGVIIAVVDTGLEIAHEDLVDNIVSGGSWDFDNSDTDPTNEEDSAGDHGTSVGGLVASRGGNSIGGTGVAPRASLVGFNFLKAQSNANYISALGGSSANPTSNNVYIFNQSYGSSNTDDYLVDETLEAHLIDGVTTLRSGKGAIYIKSAGNGFGGFGSALCTNANTADLSCQNTNMDAYNTLPYNIVVGAVNALGKRSSYSTAGSGVWISAPGGEYGANSSYVSNGSPDTYYPAMITTDQSGCVKGYSPYGGYSFTFNAFQKDHAENLNCNYTSTFNGTSSAAPVLSGAVALLLDKEPNLTWRDVKHVLASTADKIDETNSGTDVSIDTSTYKAELGWVTNDAGYHFHNYYGFGRVDVDAAIKFLDTYVADSLGTLTDTLADGDATGDSIVDCSTDALTDTAMVTTDLTVEAVQVTVKITHPNLADLGIELTSPSGTKSILFTVYNGFGDSDNLNMVLLSNTFYGEASNGNWTIRVVDSVSGATGTLDSWSIKVFGHETPAEQLDNHPLIN